MGAITTDIESYLRWLTIVRRKSAQTIRAYGSTLRALDKYLAGDTLGNVAGDVTVGLLEEFVNRPRAADGRVAKPASVRRDVATLKSFYGWCEREGISKNYAVDLYGPTVHNENPRPLPDDDWVRLWTFPALDQHERAWLALGFFGGLRRAELASLRPDQVMLEGRTLVNFVRKGGGEASLPLGVMLDVFDTKMPHLLADRAWPAVSQAVKLGSISQVHDGEQIAHKLRRLCRAAGIGSHTPHALRHSTATNLLRCGVPLHLVQRMLNHASPVTTMRYAKAGGSELENWLNGTA